MTIVGYVHKSVEKVRLNESSILWKTQIQQFPEKNTIVQTIEGFCNVSIDYIDLASIVK